MIPPADVNTGCLKLNGDPAANPGPSVGNKDAAAAAAAAFDADMPLFVGKIDELPDPADDGLGESAEFPSAIEEWFCGMGVDVEDEDVAVDNAPLLLPATELPPKLGDGDMLFPDLALGDIGR